MIRSELKTLMAQRDLNAAKVSKDTGISRTTLGALVNNTAHGIQFETLNTLCMYLSISPDDLLHFFPYDVTWRIVETGHRAEHKEFNVIVLLTHKGRVREYVMWGECGAHLVGDEDGHTYIDSLTYHVWYPDVLEDGTPGTPASQTILEQFFSSAPHYILSMIHEDVEEKVMDMFSGYDYAVTYRVEGDFPWGSYGSAFNVPL